MELQWQPSYVMQDAQQSTYNAIKRLFPDIEVLMCYYHVTENIRKKCKPYISNREDVYDELKAAVHEMYMSSSEEEYEQLKKEFKDTFKRYKDLLAYMDAQWFDGPFCKWQIFRTPPGYATTNSNIESFNATVKRDFTNRKRQSIMNAINIVEEIITYYSTHYQTFSVSPRYNYKLKTQALKVDKSKFIYKKNKKQVAYEGKNNKHEINLNDNNAFKYHSCNCKSFLKFAICLHLVAFSNFFSLDLYDPKYKPGYNKEEEERFVYKTKRGRRRLAEPALVKEGKTKNIAKQFKNK
jgi:hypothetical protein